MVGHRPLEASILVRIQVRQQYRGKISSLGVSMGIKIQISQRNSFS